MAEARPQVHPKLVLARRYQADGELEPALQACEAVIASHPKAYAARVLRCELLQQMNRWPAMLEASLDAVRTRPRNVEARLRHAECLLLTGKTSEALEKVAAIEQSAVANKRAGALRKAARFYESCGQSLAASRCWQQAAELKPDDPDILFGAANSALKLGHGQAAEQLLKQLLNISPDHAMGWYLQSSIQRYDVRINNINKLAYYIDSNSIINPANAPIYFALAKEMDDVGSTEDASKLLALAAPLVPATHKRKMSADIQLMKQLIKLNREDNSAREHQSPESDTQPLIIIGLPHSGAKVLTTLLASKLSSSKAYESSSAESGLPPELDLSEARLIELSIKRNMADQNLDGHWIEHNQQIQPEVLANDYLQRCQDLTSGARLVLDGAADNWATACLIQRSLPGTRMIHVHRHPMDQALAVYRSWPTEHEAYPDSRHQLGEYLREYERLMNHWAKVCGTQLLSVDYDLLMLEPEPQMARISRFLDLPENSDLAAPLGVAFEPSTPSEHRIRRMIEQHPGGRWRRYETLLEPVANALNAPETEL